MAPATAATTSSATAATCGLKAEAEVTQEHAATTSANINPDAFWLDLSMVIMLTDGYGSYPGRALAQVCQSARHHCGGKPIRFHTVQFPSNGSRGQVMEQIAESVRQQAAGDDFAAKSSFLHSIDGTFDHTNLNARAPWSFFWRNKSSAPEKPVCNMQFSVVSCTGMHV